MPIPPIDLFSDLSDVNIGTFDAARRFAARNSATGKIEGVALGSAAFAEIGAAAGNVPALGSDGRLAAGVVPPLTLVSVTGALGFSPENPANKDAANGYAGLGPDRKIPGDLLPALAISDTFVPASQAAMLALAAERGDVAVRTDVSRSFILRGDDPSVLANWQELQTPTTGVSSFNTRIGAITLVGSDVTTALGYTPVSVTNVAAVAMSGAFADLIGGISDVQHGNRAGGALHAAAVAGGVAGFLSGADKAKLDGIAEGAQPGTVTSVGLALPDVIFNAAVPGSPVVGAGTFAPTLKAQAANTFLAGPAAGVDVAPTFRGLAAADLAARSLADLGTRLHSDLTGLAAGDPHTQYALLAGRVGGQSLSGGTAASEALTLDSTAHATKGNIFIGPVLQIDNTGGLKPITGGTLVIKNAGGASVFSVAAGVPSCPAGVIITGNCQATVFANNNIVPTVLTNVSSRAVVLGATTTGETTLLVDIAVDAVFNRASSTAARRRAAMLTAEWALNTDASRQGRLILSASDFAATREGLRVEADGSAARIGFLGASAVLRQSLPAAATDAATTQALANALRTALINLGLGA